MKLFLNKAIMIYKHSSFLLICIIILSLSFSACRPERDWDLPPNESLKIGFTDSTFIFSKYPRSEIDFGYYIDSLVYIHDSSGAKLYRDYVIITKTVTHGDLKPLYPFYHISIGNVANNSSYKNIKYWYIEWPNGDIDTIYADYYVDFQGPNECSCSDPLRELKLNGKDYIIDTEYSKNGVYVFD